MKYIKYTLLSFALLASLIYAFTLFFPTEKNLLKRTINATANQNHEKSVHIATQLILTNVSNPKYYYFRAYNYFHLGKYKEALADLERATKKRVDETFIFLRAETLVKLKRFSEAHKDYLYLIKRQPHIPEYRLSLGIAYAREGNLPRALAIFKGALKFKPKREIFHYDLACIYAISGKPENSLKHLKKAVEYGFINMRFIKRDPDLASIRNRPEFKALIQ